MPEDLTQPYFRASMFTFFNNSVFFVSRRVLGSLTPCCLPVRSMTPGLVCLLVMILANPLCAQEPAPPLISESSNLYAALPPTEWSNVESAVDRGLGLEDVFPVDAREVLHDRRDRAGGERPQPARLRVPDGNDRVADLDLEAERITPTLEDVLIAEIHRLDTKAAA